MKEASSFNWIIDLAKEMSFRLVWHKQENCLLRFKRDGYIVDVWYSKMTVGIYIDYDKEYYHKVTKEHLTEFFSDPNGYC